MTNKPGPPSSQMKRFQDEHSQVTEVVCIIAPVECYSGYK